MLCHCITAANRERYEAQLSEMHRQRHSYFVDMLGWRELRRSDGRDVDDYDNDETAYLMVTGDAGEVHASVRMNPTWNRYQLEEGSALRVRYGDIWIPSGPSIWECSRLLGAQPDAVGHLYAAAIFGLLLGGMQEFCLRRRISSILSLIDMKVASRLQVLGWRSVPYGTPKPYDTDHGEEHAMAISWAADKGALARIRQKFRLSGPTLYEAPPVLDASDFGETGFALLDSAAEIATPEGRKEALVALHSILRRQPPVMLQ